MRLKSDLDVEQRSYVECNTLNNIVVGHPGSGKTTCLENRIGFLLSPVRMLNPRSQLVMTFFKATQLNLLCRLNNVFGNLCNQQVRTVHSICYSLLKQNQSFSDVTTVIVRVLRTPDDKIRSYFSSISHIYVDEAQVLNQTMVELLVKIRRSCPWISVDLLGDPAQGIWNQVQSMNDEFMLKWMESGNIYELVNNYRSTRSIVEFCNLTRPSIALQPMRAVRGDEGEVCLFVGSANEQQEFFLESLSRRLQEGGTIAVICANRHSHASMADHVCAQDVNNWLRTAGHEVSVWYDETRSRGEASGRHIDGRHHDESTIIITTTHQALGSEFDHCFVFAYHHKTNKRTPSASDHYHHTKMQHVAKSRSRRTLTLFAGPQMHLFYTSPTAMNLLTLYGARPKLLSMRDGEIANRHFRSPDEEEEETVVKWGSLHDLCDQRLTALLDLYENTFEGERCDYVFGPLTWNNASLPEFSSLKTFYGIFAENCVYSGFLESPPEQAALQKFCDSNLIIVAASGNNEEAAQYLIKKLNLMDNRMQTKLSDLQKIRTSVESIKRGAQTRMKRGQVMKWQHILKLLDEIISKALELQTSNVLLHFETPGKWCDLNLLRQWARRPLDLTRLDDHSKLDLLFDICMFWWQYENHAGYRMTLRHNEHREALRHYAPFWLAYGRQLGAQTQSQVRCGLSWSSDSSKRIVGCADIMNGTNVVELKLASAGISTLHKIQASGYAKMLSIEMFGSVDDCQLTSQVVNLFTGESVSLPVASGCAIADLFDVLFGVAAEKAYATEVATEKDERCVLTNGCLIDTSLT